jgi:dipeptidyl aminopeptidase/acylaminoacyl peptidase
MTTNLNNTLIKLHGFTFILFTFFIANIPSLDANEISVEEFFCDSSLSGVTLSPDGSKYAALVPISGGTCSIEEDNDPKAARVLLVMDLKTGKPTLLSGTADNARISSFFWLTNDRIGFYKQPTRGLDAYDLWAINSDGKKLKRLVPGKWEDGYPTGASLVFRMDDDPDHVLVSYNKRRPKYSDIYKLNIFSGRTTAVAIDPVLGNDTLLSWAIDQQGVVRGYYAVDGLYYKLYHRNSANEDFKLLRTFKFQEPSFVPQDYDYDPRYLYVVGQPVDKNGNVLENSDTNALWKYDTYEDKFVEKIFSHPTYDVGGIAISDKTKKPVFVAYAGEKIEYVYLDKEYENLQKSLEMTFPGSKVSMSMDLEETKAIVSVYSDTKPGEYYLFDKSNGSLMPLGKSRPWVNEALMSPMQPITFTARDGMEIRGYLTVPKDSDGKNLPLIVNPHGGPNARDMWGFNSEHQFFANRGYAVLSINFRGSSGYGRSHTNSANKEWGGSMQDDITDGLNWAINSGIANPDRVCIYGASYGGYAVMAGITFTPDLYKCAVNYVGVTDLEMMLKNTPEVWEIWDEQQKVEVGDLKTDLELIRQRSPINYVDRINVPLYIVHGVRDWRVDIEHARKLRRELENNGKVEGEDFYWLVKADEGHGFVGEANRVELYKELDKFFKKYL